MNDWIAEFQKSTDPGLLKLLMMGYFSVHCTAETHGRLATTGTIIEMLPPNYTSKLQPLDVGVNKPFKDAFRRQYSMAAANHPVEKPMNVT
jgi:hypothetical protein